MPHPAPLPQLLRRDLTRAILLRAAGMVVGVEGIYLSDKLLTELLAHTLKFGLGIGFLLQTLILALPEILLLGLPPALFVALYLALLAKRESGEFLVLQSMGLPPTAVLRYLAGAGVVAGALALVLAGWVQPLASGALADKIRDARISAISNPLNVVGQFLTLPPITIYAHGRGTNASAAVFAVMRRDDGGFDVITAQRGETQIDATSDKMQVYFAGSEILSFNAAAPDAPLATGQRLQTKATTFTGITINLPPSLARQERLSGLTATELLASPSPDSLAEGLARLFTAVLAGATPILAGLALARAGGWTLRGQIFPVAVLAGILAAGLALPALADQIARLGAFAALTSALLLIAVALVGAGRRLCRDHRGWMLPSRVQP